MDRCPNRPGGLSFDGLAVWSVVLAHPGATQREVFGHLMPNIGRRRVKEALLEGLEQGWLDLRQDKAGGRHRHYLGRTVVTRDGAIEAAIAVLEHALADGQRLDRQKVQRLTAVLRRVVPINTQAGERLMGRTRLRASGWASRTPRVVGRPTPSEAKYDLLCPATTSIPQRKWWTVPEGVRPREVCGAFLALGTKAYRHILQDEPCYRARNRSASPRGRSS